MRISDVQQMHQLFEVCLIMNAAWAMSALGEFSLSAATSAATVDVVTELLLLMLLLFILLMLINDYIASMLLLLEILNLFVVLDVSK